MLSHKSESITIRRAASADAEALCQFNCLMALETEGKALLPDVVSAGVRNLIENSQRGFYLVAEHEAQVIASLMITTEWSDWRNGSFWWIQSVYVMPEWRRHSVYRRLYAVVKKLAEEDGRVCGFRLYVEKDNAIAQRTYKNLGMNETAYLMFEELVST